MEFDEKILVVEFGSQYSHLIVRNIRRLGVYAEIIYPEDITKSFDDSVKGLILSGGPMSVYDESSPKIDRDILEDIDVPVLGICYGHQLIAYLYDGVVEKGDVGEYGGVRFRIMSNHILFEGIPKESTVWMSHKDVVVEPPNGFKVLGYTEYTRVAAMADDSRKLYSLQFHPEVIHSEYGGEYLRNFIYGVCRCRGGYDPIDIIEKFVEEYRGLDDVNALVAVSGGVDSTVTAYILYRIFGDRLHLVYIDTGFTRDRDKTFIECFFRESGFKNIHILDRRSLFIDSLEGLSDPEMKRRVFSRLYFETLNSYVSKLEERYGVFRYLGQGTLYPDVVESGRASRYTDRIKSHHNVVYRELSRLELIEPLRYLYKDEVRDVAKKLGIPRDVYMRHPFPGPGYLVRIVGRVDREKLRIVKEVDRIVEEELIRHGLYDSIWQGFAAILDTKSVGVKGDVRSYEYIIVIRLVESVDGMTARHVEIPYNILNNMAKRILDEIQGVNRVLYDLSDKPPSTIEFE